jgi:hypothetical protein
LAGVGAGTAMPGSAYLRRERIWFVYEAVIAESSSAGDNIVLQTCFLGHVNLVVLDGDAGRAACPLSRRPPCS